MLNKESIKLRIKTKIIEVKPLCPHHWKLSGEEGTALRGRQAVKHPDCIGRKSTCKLCGITRILPERVW